METNESMPKKKLFTGKKILIGVGVLIVLIAIARPKKGNSEGDRDKDGHTESGQHVGLKQALTTKYFDVTVTDLVVTFQIQTGNEFADKQADEGNIFLVMKTQFKNTDTESRMLTDGVLLINTSDGKEFKFEKSETIMADGWGIILKNMNPLTTITTKVVYQIPEKLKAKVYYQPSRSEKKTFLGDFDLTNLK